MNSRLFVRIFIGLAAIFAGSIPALAQQTTAVGDTVTGQASGLAMEYFIKLNAGQTVTIDLMSDDFDTILSVFDASGTELNSDDDGGIGTNSQLFFLAPETGNYIIRVDAFAGSPVGPFTLTITPDEAEPIAVGDRDEGEITEAITYEIELEAGQCVAFQFGSPDGSFDATLAGYDPEGVEVFSNDDGGNGLNAYVDYCAQQTGNYSVVAGMYSGGMPGNFVFESGITEPMTLVAADGTAYSDGIASATLTDATAEYTVKLSAGEGIQASVSSDDFDTKIALLDAEGTEVASDDDGGEGTNSQLYFEPVADGPYTIRVTSFSSTVTGDYELRVVRPLALLPYGNDGEESVETINAGDILLGQAVMGTVAANERRSYDVDLPAGTTVTITLESSDFDAYLRLNSGTFELAADDDSGGFLNAQIVYDVEFVGDYQIIVGSTGDGGAGSYTLTVE